MSILGPLSSSNNDQSVGLSLPRQALRLVESDSVLSSAALDLLRSREASSNPTLISNHSPHIIPAGPFLNSFSLSNPRSDFLDNMTSLHSQLDGSNDQTSANNHLVSVPSLNPIDSISTARQNIQRV